MNDYITAPLPSSGSALFPVDEQQRVHALLAEVRVELRRVRRALERLEARDSTEAMWAEFYRLTGRRRL